MPLLILATTILQVCGDDVPERARGFQALRATLRMWPDSKVQDAAAAVKSAESHREVTALLAFDPTVSLVAVRGLVELLKLMPQDLEVRFNRGACCCLRLS